jgi:hypothetical protein
MELAHARHLQRGATAFDQEAIATLILSGRFVGFLPEHYADAFVRAAAARGGARQPALRLRLRQRAAPLAPAGTRGAGLHRALRAAHAPAHPPPSGQS